MKIFIHPHTDNQFKVCWICPRTELIIKEGLSKLPQVELVDSELAADFVIFHHVPQYGGQKSFELINKVNPKKLIVIDSIDEQDEYFLPEITRDSCLLYFKRSLYYQKPKEAEDGICKPSFSYKNPPGDKVLFDWDYAILEGFIQSSKYKDIDIGCYLRPSCDFRNFILRMMNFYKSSLNKKHLIHVGEISNGSRSIGKEVYFDEKYFDALARTKIVVSSGPAKWKGCSRASEAFANRCLYMSNEAYTGMSHPPQVWRHWIKINPYNALECITLFEGLLEQPDFLNHIANDGHEHAMKYHTAKARMQYVLDKIEENS